MIRQFKKLTLLLSLLPVLAWASSDTPETENLGQINVLYLNDYQDDQQLKIDAQISINLSDKIKAALVNEVPLFFVTEIELNEQYDFLGFDAIRNRVSIRYETQLRYFSYNRSYVLINQRNQKVQNFSNLKEALRTVGTLDNFKITDLANLHPTTLYKMQLRIRFDPWALPTPMIIDTLFTKGWNLESPWHKIEIHSPNSWL